MPRVNHSISPLDRAMTRTAGLTVTVEDTSAGRFFLVPSSDGCRTYSVESRSSEYLCTCPAGKSRQTCKHVAAVVKFLDRAPEYRPSILPRHESYIADTGW